MSSCGTMELSPLADISSLFQQYEQQATPSSFRSPERQNRDYSSLTSCGIHSMDSYGLGILMRDVLFSQTRVPSTLQKALQRLMSANPKSRPRVVGLLKCPIFQFPIHYIATTTWRTCHSTRRTKNFLLAEYLKWRECRNLLPYTSCFHSFKVALPPFVRPNSLLKQDLYKREVLSMLPVLFGIWERFSIHGAGNEDFIPTIGNVMRIQDRAVRGALLQKMTLLEQQFDDKHKYELNAQVFEPMCSGFSDSSAALRELTLKSSLVLVPNLSPTNLEKLESVLDATAIGFGTIDSHQ